ETEILSLTPARIDLEQRNAWVTADGAKSGYARAVPLNDDAMAVLRRRLPKAKRLVFVRSRQRGPGEETPIQQIDRRILVRACAAVGIEDFRFHDFRHTWASWHVQRGTPLMVLKELGGWETIEMVQKYAHLAPSHVAAHANTVMFWSERGPEKEKAA
ncbi:MAG: site-specific integrase, partial [Pigmentiphaga sp.]